MAQAERDGTTATLSAEDADQWRRWRYWVEGSEPRELARRLAARPLPTDPDPAVVTMLAGLGHLRRDLCGHCWDGHTFEPAVSSLDTGCRYAGVFDPKELIGGLVAAGRAGEGGS